MDTWGINAPAVVRQVKGDEEIVLNTTTNARTVVLGGGGTVGVAWQTGLLTGLRDTGVELAGASAIVGTSAGALFGALLSSGRDVTDALAVLATVGQRSDFAGLTSGSETFLNISRQAALAADPQQALRAIGSAAQEATTMLAEDDVTPTRRRRSQRPRYTTIGDTTSPTAPDHDEIDRAHGPPRRPGWIRPRSSGPRGSVLIFSLIY